MNELYLYFRTSAALADDDAAVDSVCFPLSSMSGYLCTSASGVSTVTIFFKSVKNYNGMDQATNAVTISDSVIINLVSTATQREFRKEFVAAINRAKENPNKNFLVIGDDLSTDPRYFSSLIASVGTVSIAGQHS
tara:strand:- start:72 stop:476 length:405 start_codon:yes stop_codon:yes gene_type:complete